MTNLEVLKSTSFGQRVAEEEADNIASYFVETDDWQQIYRGDIDIIYGDKGSGKSAIYTLLQSRSQDLMKRGIILIAAENPRGTPAFQEVLGETAFDEYKLGVLWKLYFCSLLHSALASRDVSNKSSRKLGRILRDEGLARGKKSLSSILSSIAHYVESKTRISKIEGRVHIDPTLQTITGMSGEIELGDQERDNASERQIPTDTLLQLANSALEEAGYTAWLMLDRLDVAFSTNPALEAAALRSLFRVYLDVKGHPRIHFKIFLRTDIWSRLTDEGFREASHITRDLTIMWSKEALINLILMRALANYQIRTHYKLKDDVRHTTIAKKEDFLYRLWPMQVDVGTKKPTSIDWVLSRTSDGNKYNAPREIIHFLNSLRDTQIRFHEQGGPKPEGEALFSRQAFKDALPDVSRAKLAQTLYAEYPSLKGYIEALRGNKTLYTASILSTIWRKNESSAIEIAEELVRIGFFELKRSSNATSYNVPFLYRPALNLTQGAAA